MSIITNNAQHNTHQKIPHKPMRSQINAPIKKRPSETPCKHYKNKNTMLTGVCVCLNVCVCVCIGVWLIHVHVRIHRWPLHRQLTNNIKKHY